MRPLTERYALGQRIGQGGVGVVYTGLQTALGRPVAIKLLRQELTRHPAAVARFEREARTTSLLNHPNVVTVYDVGNREDGLHFVVMELLQGETLGRLLDRRGRLSVDEALHLGWQIVRGMGAGQGVGLVHRDLKPENLYVLPGNHLKVLDFGLATLTQGRSEPAPLVGDTPLPVINDTSTFHEDTAYDPWDSTDDASPPDLGRLTRPGALMGTPRYMAPEQVLAWGVDHRTDLYAFGVILYEMLGGRTPFQGPEASDFLKQQLHEPPPDLSLLAPDAPRPLVRLVHRLLEKSPEDRFSDWAALADALRLACPNPLITGHPLPRPDDAPDLPRPSEPFRFLNPFNASSRAIFFGRESDARRFRDAWEHSDRTPVIAITGASGVGKTSFLGARVIPGLEDTGHLVLRVQGTATPLNQLRRIAANALASLTPEPRDRPLAELLDALVAREGRPIAIVLDQLEEVFTNGGPEDARALQIGLASVLGGGHRRVRLLLSLREDYLGALLRSLHPLPVDQIIRTLPLRPLEANDLREALEGPGRDGLPVAYGPYGFEPGLVDEIVADLLRDTAGEVAPRVQAVGARLWAMVADDPGRPIITRKHYRERLGGAHGILGRLLDEAIKGLAPADQGVAKELLRALTHLPGSPTSRPAPSDQLVGFAEHGSRRLVVLRQLEDRWRVIQGFQDPRWPTERSYRIAHESLIQRIQHYGQDDASRNRARQLFHQGFSIWLQGGRRDEDLLPEQHFGDVLSHIDELVLRTSDEQIFYADSLERHNAGWLKRRSDARRARMFRRAQLTLVPVLLLTSGVLLGQLPMGFPTVREAWVRVRAALHIPHADLRAASLRDADLHGLGLPAADFTEADLQGANLRHAQLPQARFVRTSMQYADLRHANLIQSRFADAQLWGARFHLADLRNAEFSGPLDGADFSGAIVNGDTQFPGGTFPDGVIGPGSAAPGLQAPGAILTNVELVGIQAPHADLSAGDLSGIGLDGADLQESSLVGTTLEGAHLVNADLRGADLTGADLTDADLQHARLEGANLSGAVLRGARLTRARLMGAELCGADFTNAIMSAANFKDATVCADTVWPLSGPPSTLDAPP